MATHRLKHSFSAGELSPLMEARTDFKRFNNGCLKLRNMKCTTQGPVTRRVGTELIANLMTVWDATAFADERRPDLTKDIRTIPFVFNEVQSYVLIFYKGEDLNTYVMLANNGALLLESDSVPYDTSPFTVVPSTHVFSYPDLANIARTYNIRDNDGVVTIIFPADYTEVILNDNDVELTVNSGNFSSGRIECNATYADSPLPILIELDRPKFDIANFDYAQSADEMYIAEGGHRPFIIQRKTHTLWETIYANISFSTNNGVDGNPIWNNAQGWPETVTFHQQRLVFGSTAFYRQTVWCSASSDFDNFNIIHANPILASDPVQFTLDSDTQNKIRWMQSGKALLIGTLGNEWTVTGSTISALTPTNILSQRQTNLGSERLKPLMVGITTLFLERFGRTVNEFVYDFNTDSYKTSDMSVLSKHVTDDYSIKYWDYQQTPDSIIWGVREDGILLGITYQRQHEVIGWHVHNTDGEFKTVTCIPGQSREDEVWSVVQRTIDGEDKLYLEKFASEFLGDEASDGHFLDSHVHNETLVFPGNYGLFPFVEVTPVPEMRQNLSAIAGDTDFALQLDVAEFYWPDGSTDGLVFELRLWGDVGPAVPGGGFEIKLATSVTGGAGTRTLLLTTPATGYVSAYLQLIAVPKDINSVSSYPVAKVSKASLILEPEGAATELAVNSEFTDQTGWTSFGTTSIVNGDDIATIQDLSHLEGKEVAIIADGVVQDSQTVVRGAVYVPDAATDATILVGLNYESEIWPTIKDLEQKDGTSAGRVQRITNLDFDLYETGSFIAGRWSKATGEQEEYVSLEVAGDDPLLQIPLFTGYYHFEFPEGYDRDATYFIKQKQPLPLTIRAVVDTIEVYK